MAKIKRRLTTTIRKNDGEIYRFKAINNVLQAIVPGVEFKGQPMLITLKEFNELEEVTE